MSATTVFDRKKTALPAGTTKASLKAKCKPVTITIDGRPFTAEVREFSTGSVGFNINDKLELTLADGSKVKCQVGVNITVIGSKEVPAE